MDAIKNLELDFQKISDLKQPVVPVVVQEIKTQKVVMLAYANKQAVQQTLQQGKAVFWSTSRNELWVKGATSGNQLKVIEVLVNCKQSSLLYLVELAGSGVCHTQDAQGQYRPSCFYRRVQAVD